MFFLNGGDSFNNKIPEGEVCNRLGIKMIDGIGEKVQSSSYPNKKCQINRRL